MCTNNQPVKRWSGYWVKYYTHYNFSKINNNNMMKMLFCFEKNRILPQEAVSKTHNLTTVLD